MGQPSPCATTTEASHPGGHALHQEQPHTATRESSCSSPSKGDPPQSLEPRKDPCCSTFCSLGKFIALNRWAYWCYGLLPTEPQTGVLHRRNLYSHDSGGWQFKNRVLTGLVSPRLLSSACRWSPPHPPLVISCGSPCVLISSYKDTGQPGLMPILKASFNLNYLFKDCLQIQLHFEAPGVRSLLTKIINK